jgi:error-prone DNA polymerase
VNSFEGKELEWSTIPGEISAVYEMISDADTVGTFQVESRAQMQTLPKLAPKTFYDLVVSVAIIRPGPIQGDMVHPYLRRRAGTEPVEYPHPALKEILGKTYGVPLFQEQVMKIAVSAAGFSGGEADELRRAIGWNSKERIDRLRDRLINGMLDRGISKDYAERVFRMVQGFGGYGFPESHAASFALIAYASCYLKRYHPASFLTALLNSQPMGFYSANTLVQDAKRHGVEVRPVSVLKSVWDSELEPGDEAWQRNWWDSTKHDMPAKHTPWADHVFSRKLELGLRIQPAVRLGLRQIHGLSREQADRIVSEREKSPFASVADLVARAKLSRGAARTMASAGAFSDLGKKPRRQVLWKLEALGDSSSMFAGVEPPNEVEPDLPPITNEDQLALDYESTGLSADSHPMALLREEMRSRGISGFDELETCPNGRRIRVAGMAITRQRPGTASGVVFITLEDEKGHINLVLFPQVFDRFQRVVSDAHLLVAEGKVQKDAGVINVIVEGLEPLRR